jgi:hypothetical protein
MYAYINYFASSIYNCKFCVFYMFLWATLFEVQDAFHLHGYMDIVKIHGYKNAVSL